MEAFKASLDSEFDENAENALAGPKKRGRPLKVGSKVNKVKSVCGRSRSPINPEDIVERIQKTNEEKDTNGISNGKRGRPSKLGKLNVGHAIAATGKGRGRPKAENDSQDESSLLKKKSTDKGDQDNSPLMKNNSTDKGVPERLKKEVSESDDERSAEALDESNNEDAKEPKTVGRPATGAVNLNIECTGRGQGLNKQDVAVKRAAKLGNDEGTSQKRGRPSGASAPKQSTGKPRERQKAAEANSDKNDIKNVNVGKNSQKTERNNEEFQEPAEKTVYSIGRKMSFEQRAKIKFCFKIGKTFTETYNLMKQVYGNDCLSRARVHEWFKRFQDGREDIKDDEHPGPSNTVVTQSNIEKVREFIKNEPKSTLRQMEMELNMSKNSIHRILTEHLHLRKVCDVFQN